MIHRAAPVVSCHDGAHGAAGAAAHRQISLFYSTGEGGGWSSPAASEGPSIGGRRGGQVSSSSEVMRNFSSSAETMCCSSGAPAPSRRALISPMSRRWASRMPRSSGSSPARAPRRGPFSPAARRALPRRALELRKLLQVLLTLHVERALPEALVEAPGDAVDPGDVAEDAVFEQLRVHLQLQRVLEAADLQRDREDIVLVVDLARHRRTYA